MASIRARITLSFALALTVTLGIVTAAVVAQRRAVAIADLRERGRVISTIAARMVANSSTSDEQTYTLDFTTMKGFGPRMVQTLAALPEYVIVLDSGRVMYRSPSVAALSDSDQTQLLRSAPQITETGLPRVQLATGAALVTDLRNVERVGQSRQVVVAVAMDPVQVATREVVEAMSITGGIILLFSIVLAWWITARIEEIDRMIDDVSAISDGRSLHRRIPVEGGDDEIGRLGVTLNAMIARLETSFAGLRRFTADASHELKTPLTVLRADIERAMTAPARGTEQLVALEEALQETARMADLVESLLTLARADEGRFDLHREPVSVDALARDVAETAHILGESAGLTVSVTSLTPATVMGDRVRLRQLFLNLITNAIKYTARGGRVDVSLETRDGHAVFSVKDTGIGIAGADLPFIFDRFWRVDRARSRSERGGVGLGLAISQWIAQAHGGSITVTSRMGRGSTFSVSIPLAPTEA
ncbi:MAG: HAMP domain-containing protein [Gemmatimonadetes bacterium]|nr:HAMP domain-containing protein [Gemmatimonadota bacterium]MBI3566916.1 HAMP domain-containing protein [Gemmatimonadota bacterium]